MTNEDYQLEELENAAVKKSNNAKRIAVAAGLLATGGAAGYAATHLPFGASDEVVETLTEEDIDSVADTGADQVQEPQEVQQQQPVQPTPPPTTTYVEPTPPAEEEVDVSFDKTTHYYDEDNNLLLTTEEGTIDGHKFTLYDVDGDRRADALSYDKDGNGIYNEDEFVELEGKDQIAMGHPTSQHEDQFLTLHEPEPEPIYVYPEPYDLNEEKDYADNNTIHNDFEDEKTGETYEHDYAENNNDYDNGDAGSNSAHTSDDVDYVYDEDLKDQDDYDNLAENEVTGDSFEDVAENTTDDTFDDLGSDALDIV